MKISTTHQRFVDLLNDQTALEYPERFLGPNWKDVLNFWIYLDTLSIKRLKSINEEKNYMIGPRCSYLTKIRTIIPSVIMINGEMKDSFAYIASEAVYNTIYHKNNALNDAAFKAFLATKELIGGSLLLVELNYTLPVLQLFIGCDN
jgi:hypothetical protein